MFVISLVSCVLSSAEPRLEKFHFVSVEHCCGCNYALSKGFCTVFPELVVPHCSIFYVSLLSRLPSCRAGSVNLLFCLVHVVCMQWSLREVVGVRMGIANTWTCSPALYLSYLNNNNSNNNNNNSSSSSSKRISRAHFHVKHAQLR